MGVHPPTDERVLWSLRRRRTDVRCVLRLNTRPVEVVVLQDRDPVFVEHFGSADLAELWAEAYAGRLRGLGWVDSGPGDGP